MYLVSKKIKILFTIPNFDTAGSGKALLNIAKGLNPNEFEAHIACKTNQGKFFATVLDSGIPVHVFNYEPPMRPLSMFFTQAWKISRKIKKIQPDIIHSFHYNNNYGEAVAARLAGAKWIFTKKNMNWGSDGANAWKIRSVLANKIIIQNQEMKRRFYSKSTKTELIERGIILEQFYATSPDPQLRVTHNTPESARIILTVANLVPVKGVEFLVEAFIRLTEKHPDWHLWLVGDDATQTGVALKKLVQKFKLEHKIHFTGKQTDVRAYLNHAEIFVLPTKATGEGSPVALIEAMANGKVVIGTNVPGIADQLEQVPSHLVAPENAEALAAALDRLMKNDTETNRVLGSSFLKNANAKYALQREIERHQIVYRSLLSS